jgi:RES domain-containing protein
MTPPPCRGRSCPVAEPSARLVAAVAGHVLPAGTDLARGHRTDQAAAGFPPAGAGRAGRFSPLPGVAHTYLARLASAAVLETALRDVTAAAPLVTRPHLAGWAVSNVSTTRPVALADLRGPALAALELRPEQLTTAGPAHYGCTGRWAAALHAAGFDGVIWHSRQAALHRARVEQVGGLAQLALTHAAVEVMVYWGRDDDDLLAPGGSASASLLRPDGSPDRLVTELAALLGLHLELG